MSLCGSLDEFSLLDVLALIGAHAGYLDVELPGGVVTLWVHDGGVGRVETTWLPPSVPLAEVIFAVLAERGGRFEFEAAELEADDDVTRLADLAHAVAELAGEWVELADVAPRQTSQVSLATDLLAERIAVDGQVWAAVRLLAAGPLTLGEVAERTGSSPMQARRLLRPLFSAGGLAVGG